jgi:uncharacterized protein YndB with AHSA1/START domain
MAAKHRTNVTAEPGKLDVVITRDFDPPRELVFKAHTDSELYAQWLGPRRLTTKFTLFEPRAGGSWRFINEDAEGNVYAFHGVYHEVTTLERIISTFEYDGLPEAGHVLLATWKFEALPGGGTRLISQSVYQSVTDRDAMIQEGMMAGVNEGYEKLDDLLAKLQG